MQSVPTPRRRWFRVSLREVFLAILVSGALLAWWSDHRELQEYRHYGGVIYHPENGSVEFRMRNGWIWTPVAMPEQEPELLGPAPPAPKQLPAYSQP